MSSHGGVGTELGDRLADRSDPDEEHLELLHGRPPRLPHARGRVRLACHGARRAVVPFRRAAGGRSSRSVGAARDRGAVRRRRWPRFGLPVFLRRAASRLPARRVGARRPGPAGASAGGAARRAASAGPPRAPPAAGATSRSGQPRGAGGAGAGRAKVPSRARCRRSRRAFRSGARRRGQVAEERVGRAAARSSAPRCPTSGAGRMPPGAGPPSSTSVTATPGGTSARRRPVTATAGRGPPARASAWSRFVPSMSRRVAPASGSAIGRGMAAMVRPRGRPGLRFAPMLLLVDLDGVVYRGAAPIPGVAAVLADRAARGDTVVYVTNNSMHYRADYVTRLTGLGAPVSADRVVSSARATALYLAGPALDPPGPPGARRSAPAASSASVATRASTSSRRRTPRPARRRKGSTAGRPPGSPTRSSSASTRSSPTRSSPSRWTACITAHGSSPRTVIPSTRPSAGSRPGAGAIVAAVEAGAQVTPGLDRQAGARSSWRWRSGPPG